MQYKKHETEEDFESLRYGKVVVMADQVSPLLPYHELFNVTLRVLLNIVMCSNKRLFLSDSSELLPTRYQASKWIYGVQRVDNKIRRRFAKRYDLIAGKTMISFLTIPKKQGVTAPSPPLNVRDIVAEQN
ncbi:unnamed protein product [Cylicostephanus goldi]|uniref:Uncharacterized protein n=1 Tax=Cylicostephanus goldi TaxID=71465 RepID=A0A3P6PW48_CYLGO|nr:unnamed protein product [Cylicostephanus goldi]